jgi:hypothetical protein
VPDRLPGYQLSMVEMTDPEVAALSGADRHPMVRATSDPTHQADSTVFEITEARTERRRQLRGRRLAASSTSTTPTNGAGPAKSPQPETTLAINDRADLNTSEGHPHLAA